MSQPLLHEIKSKNALPGNELTNTNWNLLFDNLNVDSCIDRFYERLENILSRFIPTIRLNSKSTKKQPWQTKQLKNLRNRKTKEHKRSSGKRDRRYYEMLRTEYKELNRLCYRSYVVDVEETIKRDPNKFFD
jgi:hypothetical protein